MCAEVGMPASRLGQESTPSRNRISLQIASKKWCQNGLLTRRQEHVNGRLAAACADCAASPAGRCDDHGRDADLIGEYQHAARQLAATAPGHDQAAARAQPAVAREPVDFPGRAAAVPASAAAGPGPAAALVAARPGSWKASPVPRLARGTAGYDDADLAGYLLNQAPAPRAGDDQAAGNTVPGADDVAAVLAALDDAIARHGHTKRPARISACHGLASRLRGDQ